MAIAVWILGDQLLKNHPALLATSKRVPREDVLVLLIQSQTQAKRYPYHAKKLTFLFSAMQHYAEELRSDGYQVDFIEGHNTISALKNYLTDHKINEFITMSASSKRGLTFQKKLSETINRPVNILPNTQFLCERYDPFPEASPDSIIRQEKFYHAMRKHFKLLINENGEPIQGKWNFDEKNRQAFPRDKKPPGIIHFEPDASTQQIKNDVLNRYHTIGNAEGFDLAVTRHQAKQAADDFFKNRLSHFGTYEDAMNTNFNILYHSKLSPYINVGLLDPLELTKRAEESYYNGEISLNNVEGFIRQIVGWREYMYWQYKRLMPGISQGQFRNGSNALPKFFWDGNTDMNCIKHVVERVLQSGYCHHIERLMILSNFCLLAGIASQEVFDWFSSAFIDAYEWVMVPNVYGMGLYVDGGKIATKPYISSANYINKMSNYCQKCSYDKNSRTSVNACPYNFLFWHFLITNERKFQNNYRMARMLYHLKNFSDQDKRDISTCADRFLQKIL